MQRSMRAARQSERGQTLPIWTAAMLTALTLMFFSLNYANVLRWQVRAQNAADAAATAALSVQATQWNKMNALLYAADVEEWRIRHLIQALTDVSNSNGGCSTTGKCLAIYQALQPQLYKAVNRYTTDIQLLQSLAAFGRTSQQADALNVIRGLTSTCGTTNPLADCAFTYHVLDYSYRSPQQQAGKDAFYVQLGGFTSPQDTAPTSDWEPAQIDLATCATVPPLIPFSLFGAAPQAKVVIGRAAATNVTETSEWMAPGVTQNPAPGANNAFFQPTEVYDPADDTFASTSAPRDWYETSFPATNYKAYKAPYDQYSGTTSYDFEVMLCWWAAIPFHPYTASVPAQQVICSPT